MLATAPPASRKTIKALAETHQADIAVNGSFFSMESKQYGKPSFGLQIHGQIIEPSKSSEPLLVLYPHKVSIVQNKVQNMTDQRCSAIASVPLLIKDGLIPRTLTARKSYFYQGKHARTAVGIKADGTLVFAIAEGGTSRDIKEIPYGEIQSMLLDNRDTILKHYPCKSIDALTFAQVRASLHRLYAVKDGYEGITLRQLAQILLKQKCTQAINLCGGGSTCLWLEGKTIPKNLSKPLIPNAIVLRKITTR